MRTRWIAFAACLSLSPTAALAGAWTLPAGAGQFLVLGTASHSVRGFDGDRSLQSIPHYDKYELQALIEYGATDWLTLMALPSLQRISIGAPFDTSRSGLGFTDLGARVRLLQGQDWVFSAQTLVRIPGTFSTTNLAAIGNNDLEVDVRALFGYAFKLADRSAFIDLQAAQRFRGNGLPSEVRLDGAFGVRLAPRWLVLLQSLNTISEGATALIPSYAYGKMQASIVYDISTQWSLQVGAFSTVWGRNALQENGGLVGAWYRF